MLLKFLLTCIMDNPISLVILLTSLLFELNDFTNSDSRFSIILSPGEPLITDDRLMHQKDPKILSDVLLRLYGVAFAIPFHR